MKISGNLYSKFLFCFIWLSLTLKFRLIASQRICLDFFFNEHNLLSHNHNSGSKCTIKMMREYQITNPLFSMIKQIFFLSKLDFVHFFPHKTIGVITLRKNFNLYLSKYRDTRCIRENIPNSSKTFRTRCLFLSLWLRALFNVCLSDATRQMSQFFKVNTHFKWFFCLQFKRI